MIYNTFENEENLILIDNETTVNVRYIGIAKNGTAQNVAHWRVIKETLDEDGYVTKSETYKTFAKWTDRANLEY